MKVDQNSASIFLKLADENLKIFFHRPSSCFLFFKYIGFLVENQIYTCMQKEKKVIEKEKGGKKKEERKKKKVGHSEN